MMRRNWLFFSLFFMTFHNISFAQSDPCANADSQAAINECMSNVYKKADISLNIVYKQASSRLKNNTEQHSKLVEAQRAWLKFRDAECAFSTGSAGTGSASSMISMTCLTSLTEQRTKQLHDYMQCPEGDISCPIPRE